jgi:predicted solute-binding protein
MGVGCKVLEKKQFLYNKTKLEEEEEIWSTWQKLTGDSGITALGRCHMALRQVQLGLSLVIA